MEIVLTSYEKSQKYKEIIPLLPHLIDKEVSVDVNLGNVFSALKYAFDFLWVGCYWVRQDTLALGGFQGPTACTKISFGKGVCGKAWEQKKSLIVPNVDEFEGHIACSSASKSEMVIPVFKNDKIIMVLDIDSEKLNSFDKDDQYFFEKIAEWIANEVI